MTETFSHSYQQEHWGIYHIPTQQLVGYELAWGGEYGHISLDVCPKAQLPWWLVSRELHALWVMHHSTPQYNSSYALPMHDLELKECKVVKVEITIQLSESTLDLKEHFKDPVRGRPDFFDFVEEEMTKNEKDPIGMREEAPPINCTGKIL